MIILVESDARQAMELDGILRGAGRRVATLLTAEAALRFTDNEDVSLVVTNLRLGLSDGNGGEGLVRTLIARNIPVIVYSPLAEHMTREILGDTVPDGVLRVPISRARLLYCVGRLTRAA